MSLFTLTGKTALITGSARGIGLAMAEGLAAAGAHVIVNSRQRDSVDAVVAQLKAKGLQVSGAAFDVAQGINQKSNTPQKYDMNMGELSKSSATKYKENLSFKEWLELDEGWMDWLASKTGKVLGAGAGYIYGFGKNLLQGLGNRIKEIYSYITKNPREATKMAAIVGTAMLTGGVVGKISHDVVNAVSNKISGIIHGVNPTEVHQTVSQISPDGSGDFKGGTSSSGDFGGAADLVGKKLNFYTAGKAVTKEVIDKIRSGEITDHDSLHQAVANAKQHFMNSIGSSIHKRAFQTDFDDNDVFAKIMGTGNYSGNAAERALMVINKAGGTPDLEKINAASQFMKNAKEIMSKPILQDD